MGIRVWIDGSTSAACYVIEGEAPVISSYGLVRTNNESEYIALRVLLRDLMRQGIDSDIEVLSDSELMVHQTNTRLDPKYKPSYVCRAKNLKPFLDDVVELIGHFRRFTLRWTRREDNPAGHILG